VTAAAHDPAKGNISVRFEGEDEPRTLRLKPVGLMAAERKFGGAAFQDHPIEAGLYAGWVSAGKPSGDFDAWADTIAELVLPEDTSPDPS
jgi:hypothetical protein